MNIKRCMGCMNIYNYEEKVCPHCGYVDGTPAEEAIHMQPRTLLNNRYIIGKVIGYGGFGVTYIAWDGRLERKVAIKEYLPSEFSTRMPGQSKVIVFNGEKNEQFNSGLNKFIDEAKRLAKFKNEDGIVKIYDSFTENETAYIVMEFLDGETLKALLDREKIIPEEKAKEMLLPIMESLQVVHKEGIIHRDIAPDNIFITKDGKVKLIDFGASRFATTSHSRSLTVIIKPGYSPEEQYRSRGDQGPHTDVYALAAVFYKMITGKTPTDAMERRVMIETKKKDELEEPRKLNKKISAKTENTILNAMNVRIEDRTPDIEAFMQDLFGDTIVKRKSGKIKKIDLYKWPLWLKIVLPVVLAALLMFGILLITNVISFSSLFSSEAVVPNGMVVVPDVENMDKDEAIEQLKNMKLTASTAGNVESEYLEPGIIVLQSPNAGSYAYEFGTIYLTISSGGGVKEAENGIATVPYVIWDTKEAAIAKLLAAGLAEPEIIEVYDDSVEAGKVISQSVEYGNKVKEGTKITITVSKGPESFAVPNARNMTKEEAIQLFEGLGMTVTVEKENSKTVEAGKVIRQSIAAGKIIKSGGTIVITVSSGDEKETAGHTHSYASSVTNKATCGSKGLRTYTCSCGDSYTEDIPATGNHAYVYTVTKEPGLGTTGTKTGTCSVCGKSTTETIPALRSSDWVPASSVPGGAEIIAQKWTYTKTEYTTSTVSSMSGWECYDSQNGWGPEQTSNSDPSNGSRKVWTTSEQYVSGSETHYCYYHRYGYLYDVNKGYYVYGFGTDASAPGGERHRIDLTYQLNYGGYIVGEPYYNGYGCDGNNWALWFNDGTYEEDIYSTRTLYHYQEPVTTYYFRKSQNSESTSDPSGESGVSNVTKYVKYVIR